MTHTLHHDYRARLRRLEAARRRQGILNGVLGCALLTSIAAGLAAPEDAVVQATRFVVVDDTGAQRATLGMLDDAVALHFSDAEGSIRASLGLSAGHDEGLLAAGAPHLTFGAVEDPLAQLAVLQNPMDEEPEPTLTLGQPSSKTGVMLMAQAGADGASLHFMTIGAGGPWGVSTPISLMAARTGPSVIQVRDQRGHLQFSTDPEAQEYDGSSHFPVKDDADAREAISAPRPPKFVECRGPRVTDETLGILAEGPGLVEVALRSCPRVGPEGLAALARIHDVRHLQLSGCKGLGAADFSVLAQALELDSLALVGIPLQDDAVRSLAKLTQLGELLLVAGYGDAGSRLEDEASVLALTSLENLERLDLTGLGILREETVAALREALPNAEIALAR